MNFKLFLFLLYVVPGRSKEQLLTYFPKNSKNSLVYNSSSNYTSIRNDKYFLNELGEIKLFSYLKIIGGFIVGLAAVSAVIIA